MSEFTPLSGQSYFESEKDFWNGFKLHMWLAFREFDITFFETYVFTIVITFSLLWAIFSVIQWVWNRRNTP